MGKSKKSTHKPSAHAPQFSLSSKRPHSGDSLIPGNRNLARTVAAVQGLGGTKGTGDREGQSGYFLSPPADLPLGPQFPPLFSEEFGQTVFVVSESVIFLQS